MLLLTLLEEAFLVLEEEDEVLPVPLDEVALLFPFGVEDLLLPLLATALPLLVLSVADEVCEAVLWNVVAPFSLEAGRVLLLVEEKPLPLSL